MKKLHFSIALLLLTLFFQQKNFAQVAINTNEKNPDPSAILDISSTDKGLLIPRVTTVQKNAISNPATGLLIFDTSTASFWFYEGAGWTELITKGFTELTDTDKDTKMQVEANTDEDLIRFDLAGTEHYTFYKDRIVLNNTLGSTIIGEESGQALSTGSNNSAFGRFSLAANTTGGENTAIGAYALNSNTTGKGNTAIGTRAMSLNTTATNNTALGYNALRANTTDSGNTAIGFLALENAEHFHNTAVGSFSLQHTSGNVGTAVGMYALQYGGGGSAALGYAAGRNATNWGNVFVGRESGINATGNQGIMIGYQAGENTSGNRNTYLGFRSGRNSGSGASNVFIGYQSGQNETGSNKLYIENSDISTPLLYGDFAKDTVKVYGSFGIKDEYVLPDTAGTTGQVLTMASGSSMHWSAFNLLQDKDADTKIQVEKSGDEDIIRFDLAGQEVLTMNTHLIEPKNNGHSVFLGEGAGLSDDGSTNNQVFIGYESGKATISGYNNTAVGYRALTNNTSEKNTALGNSVLLSNTTGAGNTGLGYLSLFANESGHRNIGLGERALRYNTSGTENVALGYQAGHSNISGNRNVFIGPQAGYNEVNSNKLYIENSASSNPLIFGDFSTDSLVIHGSLGIRDDYSGWDSYVSIIENTENNNTDRNNGLKIIAGHDNYNAGQQSSFIQFINPSGGYCGRIKQSGTTAVNYSSASDIRLKENIRPTEYGLEDLLKIKVCDYNFKSDKPNRVQTGFLAQQLHTAYPGPVDVGGEDPEIQPWSVDYSQLTPLLVKSTQELQQVIEQQDQRISALESQLRKSQSRESKIKNMQSDLEELKALLSQNNQASSLSKNH